MENNILSNSEFETVFFGEDFSRQLVKGDIISLYGELGTGKTQFVKGICKGLDISGTVTSPTFTIMNVYKGKFTINHFDLYRLHSIKEIHDIGINDFFFSESITILEWAEKATELLPSNRYDVFFDYGENENQRIIKYIKNK